MVLGFDADDGYLSAFGDGDGLVAMAMVISLRDRECPLRKGQDMTHR